MIWAEEKMNWDSTAAPELETTYAPKKKTKIRRRKKRKRYLKFPSKALIASIGLGIIFIAGVVLTLFYVTPARMGYQVVQLEKEVAELERQQKLLEVEVNRAQSLDRIASIATTRLAMVPAKYTGEAYSAQGANKQKASSESTASVANSKELTQVAAVNHEKEVNQENNLIRTTAQVLTDNYMAVMPHIKP